MMFLIEALKSESIMVKTLREHLNKNHLGEDGEPELEWTDYDVITVALRRGLKQMMMEHRLK